MRALVNITNETKSTRQILIAVEDIKMVLHCDYQPALSLKKQYAGKTDKQGNVTKETRLFNCCGGDKAQILIITTKDNAYLAPITQETLKARMMREQAEANAKFEYEYNKQHNRIYGIKPEE